MNNTYVGFSCGAHDVSYCVYDEGKVIHHYELERHNRIKECHDDIVKVFINNINNYKTPSKSFSFKMARNINQIYPESYNHLKQIIGSDMMFYAHHVIHAANAFYSSVFKEAVVISVDGGGEQDDMQSAFGMYYFDSQNNITKLQTRFDNLLSFNLGTPWGATAELLLGRGVGNQSGTLMAMAAFGSFNDEIYNILQEIINQRSNAYHLLLKYDKNDVAHTLQKITDEYFELFLATATQTFKTNNVCFVGGCSLNSSAIGKLAVKYPNLNFYVPPIPYDAGLALGVCQFYWHKVLNMPRTFEEASPYLGMSYEIPEEIKSLGKKVNEKEVIDLLQQGKIISVYSGRSESGRRALGNRSILADPTIPNIKDLINAKVKNRQAFRPFAPAILKEDVKNWFIKDIESPYMSFCIPFLDSKLDIVPAVVHKDNTGRLQTVTESLNPQFYNLLKSWKDQTGIPIILNTSFNNKEPIVETPQHALNCFKNTNIDCLYFRDEDILISR